MDEEYIRGTGDVHEHEKQAEIMSRTNTRKRTIIQYTPVIQADLDICSSIACLTITTIMLVALLKVMP